MSYGLTPQEVADKLLQITHEYSTMYTQFNETKIIDKQLWAALHIGFLGGMKLNGYSDEQLAKALDLAQKQLFDELPDKA